MKGTENHFGLRAAEQLKADDRKKYKTTSVQDVISLISENTITTVIGHRRSYRGKLRKALKVAGYVKVPFKGQVEIWRLLKSKEDSH